MSKNNTISPGQRLRAIRASQGRTATWLARQIGLSRASISQIERGKQSLDPDDAIAAARALGVAPSNIDPRLRDEIPANG